YPLRRDARLRRLHLHQYRRLGGKLHGRGRARGRANGDHPLVGGERDAQRASGGGHSLPPSSGGLRLTPLRILIVTDAWRPQSNGGVRTLEKLGETLGEMGVEVDFLTPLGFRSVPMPSYPDIRLALTFPGEVARRIDEVQPDSIHIATEGP